MTMNRALLSVRSHCAKWHRRSAHHHEYPMMQLMQRSFLDDNDASRRWLSSNPNNNNNNNSNSASRRHDGNYSSNNNSKNMTANDGLKRTVYVHPLSQIILEYLQDCRHDWIVEQGLEALTVHRDGSFELTFTSHNNNNNNSGKDDSGDPSAVDSDNIAKTTLPDKIWTSYDDEEKKHWLTVQKNSLHQRFLLQDNLLPAWHGNRKSLPERIHLSVDAMIRAIDRLEIQQQQLQHHERHGGGK